MSIAPSVPPTAMSTAEMTVLVTELVPSIPSIVPSSVNGNVSRLATSPTSRDVSSRMPNTRQKSPVTRCHERRIASTGPRPSSTTAGEANAKRVLKNR
ncbi:hypothetical protein GCM10020220_032520 [Nonomuraea rubra]